MKKICIICGFEFNPVNKQQRYCRDECILYAKSIQKKKNNKRKNLSKQLISEQEMKKIIFSQENASVEQFEILKKLVNKSKKLNLFDMSMASTIWNTCSQTKRINIECYKKLVKNLEDIIEKA